MGITMTALDRLRLENGTAAAGLEQPVDGLTAEPGSKSLIAPVAGALQGRELLLARGFLEHVANGATEQFPGHVHFNRRLGQPHLHEHRISRPAWARCATQASR